MVIVPTRVRTRPARCLAMVAALLASYVGLAWLAAREPEGRGLMKPRIRAFSVAVAIVLSQGGHALAQGALPGVVIPGGIAPPIGTVPAPELPPLALPNWGFELGLRGWTATGAAFAAQPTYEENVTAGRVGGVVT